MTRDKNSTRLPSQNIKHLILISKDSYFCVQNTRSPIAANFCRTKNKSVI